jgi:hypothetical protein
MLRLGAVYHYAFEKNNLQKRIPAIGGFSYALERTVPETVMSSAVIEACKADGPKQTCQTVQPMSVVSADFRTIIARVSVSPAA